MPDLLIPGNEYGYCNECGHEGGGFEPIPDTDSDAPLAIFWKCPRCGHENAWQD